MKLSHDILSIHKTITEAGYDLFVVGGAVRDSLLRKNPEDVDLVTNALPETVMELLADYNLDLQGKSFGVVRVFTKYYPKGIEIATYRKDITAGRNPEVNFRDVTIEEDANRRDFTINALYYNITESKTLDFVNGISDLENKIIMTPGNPLDRFNEDGLRVMRAFRFAGRIDGDLHPEVQIAILKKNPKLESILDNGEKVLISQERVWEEFTKALTQVHSPWDYVMSLVQHNIIQEVFPGFVKTGSIVMDSRKPEFVVAALMLGRFSEAVSASGRKILTKYLVQKCLLSSKQAQGVVLLMRALAHDANDVNEMYKVLTRTNLKMEDVSLFVSEIGDKNFGRALGQYKPSIDSTTLNLEGEALGIEIKKLETDLFLKLLENENSK